MLPLLRRALAKEGPLVEILPLTRIDAPLVEALLDDAFGADRRTRTAYRLREGVEAIGALSFAALHEGALVGSIQQWPIALLADDGGERFPLILVGPVAVAPAQQRLGIGRRLMEAALHAAESTADGALTMIGDPEYYGRFFNFSAEHTGGWRLPGPWEPRRLLARGIGGHAVPGQEGMLAADTRVTE